jgi:hypothetical protein
MKFFYLNQIYIVLLFMNRVKKMNERNVDGRKLERISID